MMKTFFTLTFALAMSAAGFLCSSNALSAGEAEWKVGLSRVKITPEMHVFMSGYASRDKPFSRVESDLYVKVLALEDKRGERAVIVTSDLIGFPAHVADPICQRIQKKTKLERRQILLNSSHTHTGPLVRIEPLSLQNLSPGDAQRTIVYTQGLQDKTVKAVEEALKNMKPANLSWGTGVVHFVMNRREFTPRGVILGVNPRGLADRSVPVLRVDNEKGKPMAVLYGAATHNTTLGGDCYEICGDYAGFSQEFLEKEYPGVQAMFMLGCAGDSNPYPRGKMEMSRAHGKSLGEEVKRVLGGELQPVRGPITTAFKLAKVPLEKAPTQKELEEMIKSKRGAHKWVAENMLKKLESGKELPTHYPCPISVIQFGDDLTMVGLSGEVVVDYVQLIENAVGPNKLWIAGYCNDVFGYLPSRRVLQEGGYETRGLYSGGLGFFAPQAQDVVVDAVRELAKKAGRKTPERK